MASSIVLTIKTEDTQSDVNTKLRLDTIKDKEGAIELKKYIKNMSSGIVRGIIDVQTGSAAPVAASGTITLASFADDDTLTIGGVTITGKSSPTTEDHFEIDGNDTADAAALAACINAHSTLSQVLTASSNAAIVTITLKQKGVIGNFFVIAASAHATLAQPSGGTGGVTNAAIQYNLGIS